MGAGTMARPQRPRSLFLEHEPATEAEHQIARRAAARLAAVRAQKMAADGMIVSTEARLPPRPVRFYRSPPLGDVRDFIPPGAYRAGPRARYGGGIFRDLIGDNPDDRAADEAIALSRLRWGSRETFNREPERH